MSADGPSGDPVYRSVGGLHVALDDAVLRMRLDRPAKRNAIDDEMMDALVGAFERAGTDDRVRVILLSGEGEHFCAGADIVARNDPGRDRPPGVTLAHNVRPAVGSIQRRLPSLAHRLIPTILEVQKPVVCRAQGWVAGIGFQLALAADFTVAAADATFWEPFAARGFTPDSGATWLLPRRVGPLRTRELLLLGRRLDGREAAEWGAIHQAVDSGQIDIVVEQLVAELVAGPTVALGLTKWLLHAGEQATLGAQLQNEALGLELSSRTDDFREGLTAFREKRPPRFEGR